MMVAARFRVASRSVLSAGMARIRAARDHDGGTLDSCARSWDDKYLHSSTAYFTATAFQMVNAMDRLQNFRSLPFHKMQSAAAYMIRQSGNILDIAHAICTRSSHILGFVIQHRVHSLMNGLCRTASSCKANLIVGALRVDCNGLCAATSLALLMKTLDTCSGVAQDRIVYGRSILIVWPGIMSNGSTSNMHDAHEGETRLRLTRSPTSE